jgi:hypothetical protein
MGHNAYYPGFAMGKHVVQIPLSVSSGIQFKISLAEKTVTVKPKDPVCFSDFETRIPYVQFNPSKGILGLAYHPIMHAI